MFDELNNTFPGHTHFYEVSGLMMSDAMERCARLTLDDGHVLNYQGKIIFAVKHALETADISWLNPVPGSPVDTPAVEVAPE
jgi:hypothetical protein